MHVLLTLDLKIHSYIPTYMKKNKKKQKNLDLKIRSYIPTYMQVLFTLDLKMPHIAAKRGL